MKKRIITMALAVIMLLAVLTGCGDNASNPGNDTPTTQVVKLSVGTGAVGGSVYTTGSGWANVMNNVLAGRYELTAEQTGHTVEEIYRDNEYDHWFTAQEALEYGFVDKLVSTHDTMSATKGE